MLNNAGGVVQRIGYDAFGNPSIPPSTALTRFLFTGEPSYAMTGKQDNWHRWYNPADGYWMTQDPIGFGGGQFNLYEYVGNDTVDMVDPTGLAGFCSDYWHYLWNPSEMDSDLQQYQKYALAASAGAAAGAAGLAVGGAVAAGYASSGAAAVEAQAAGAAVTATVGLNAAYGIGLATGGQDVADMAATATSFVIGCTAIGPKIQRQMGPRGWTPAQIDEAIQGGMQIPAINKATGNPATRYVHPTTGQSVVVDRVTGEVIHVGGPGFQYGPGAGDVQLLPAP